MTLLLATFLRHTATAILTLQNFNAFVKLLYCINYELINIPCIRITFCSSTTAVALTLVNDCQLTQ